MRRRGRPWLKMDKFGSYLSAVSTRAKSLNLEDESRIREVRLPPLLQAYVP